MKKQAKEKQYSPSSSGSSANGAVISSNNVSVFSKLFSHIILILRRLFGFLGLYSYLKVHPSLGWRSSTFRQGRVFRVAAYTSSVLLFLLTVATIIPIYTKSNQAEATTGTATASTLTFTSTRSEASVSLTVNSADGTFATSTNEQKASFSISTNNYTGYTLTLKSTGSVTNNDLSNNDIKINTLSESTTATAFAADTAAGKALNNKWGIIPSYYDSVANTTNYYPAPDKNSSIPIRVTSGPNSANGVGNADSYTIGLGLRADYTNPSGTYTNSVFVLEYVANEIAYAITYSDDGISGVTGLPANVSGNASSIMSLDGTSGSTYTHKTGLDSIDLASATPSRNYYTFAGWCYGTLENNGTSCTGTPGTVYAAGANFGIDKTTSNTVTLKAMWEPAKYAITFTYGDGISDVVIKDSTGTNTVATVSTSGNSANLTYGTTYSIVPTFTGDYELNAMTKTTGSGTLSGTSFTVGTGTATINITGKVDLCKGKTTLYDLVACRSKGKQTNDTNATTGIKASITAANSGVYEYDATVFGAASDAANTSAIYYYRGILDETTGSYGSDGDGKAWPNYVKLANNTCWRIVRTTGSGGVKMVYNGVYGDTAAGSCANAQTKAQTRYNNADLTVPFNTSSSSKAGKTYTGLQYQNMHAIGYTYSTVAASTTTDTALSALLGSSGNDTTTNSKSSIIKQYIEDWYASNLSSYTSMLEPSAGYCNDRTVYPSGSYAASAKLSENTQVKPYGTSGMTVYYFGAYTRNMNTAQTPTLNCPRGVVDLYSTTTASGGNGQLSQPVALLTADEMSFSGSGSSTASNGSGYNAKSFLRSGSNFWLLSPNYRFSNGYAYGFNLLSYGILNYYGVNNALGVRPAISLTSGTTAASGSGTATDPWVVTAP